MSCADAIELVIREAGRPLRAREIADEINRLGIYRRADGQPLPTYQVSSVVHGLGARFTVKAGLIELAGASSTAAVAPPARDLNEEVAAILLGCVSTRDSTARPARDLYRSELFQRRRRYAESSGRPWFIISALYGLLDPNQVVEPYDVKLADLELEQRHALADAIAEDLTSRLGELSGCVFEVHAGDAYTRMLRTGLGGHGASISTPLAGMRIGEQLAWYSGRDPKSAVPPAVPVTERTTAPTGLAMTITDAFNRGELDLSLRGDAPIAGWRGMPELIATDRLRDRGASDRDIRLFLTFTSAMDRARDADALWFAAERLFVAQPWTFSPTEVADGSLTDLADALRQERVSQRHGPDVAAWRVIAESLADPQVAPAISHAISGGEGEVPTLLDELATESPGGTDRFPFLRGPKIGPMWLRMLAFPGRARLRSLDSVPVAVDVQVRKVTEYMGVTDTGELELDAARPLIQAAWARQVSENGAAGPGPLEGTQAALDPALWFWAKWGCTRCERARRKLPIAEACGMCRFPRRS